jgi:hypothetical protein
MVNNADLNDIVQDKEEEEEEEEIWVLIKRGAW